jgi:hypothetical protein
MHLLGYQINGGDLSSLTPLQKFSIQIITDELLKWKFNNKPFVVI